MSRRRFAPVIAVVLVAAFAQSPAAKGVSSGTATTPRVRWETPSRPDLVRCGGWRDERCRSILDGYGRRVAAKAESVRATAARLPASASRVAEVDECPRAAFPGAVCGHVDVPFARNNPSAGTIAIAFELYTHTDPGPAASAILVNWGGPGAGTIVGRGSAFFLFGPNLATHDLLLIDDRGRGFSNLIDCPSLQYAVGTIIEQLDECASMLGAGVGRYGTGDVAMDTDAVRAALGYELVDYYGVSYGGADVSAYATRFPQHIRSLVLDSPWGDTPARQQEAISARTYVTSTIDVIEILCERSPSCRAERSDPAGDFASLVEHIRSDPVRGVGTSAYGDRMRVRIDPKFVIEYLMYPWGLFMDNREIAAAAAALEHGDPVPLLRLGAEGYYPLCCEPPSDSPPPPPVEYSVGSYVTTFCADTEWEWDWSSPVDERLTQHAAAIAAQPAELFLPFTGAEATDSTFVGPAYCIYWPEPVGTSPIVSPNAVYPDVPTLVIGGDLDNVVPLEIAHWMAELFPASQLVEFAGAGHGAAFWHSCATALVQEFVETLTLGDTSCADTPEFKIPSVGEFPLVAAEATAAEEDPGQGNRAGAAERRVASVAVAAAKDALARAELAFFGPGEFASRGLRGGRVEFEFKGAHGANWVIHLRNVRFAEDVIVNGVVRWPPGSVVRADLEVSGSGTAGGELAFSTDRYLAAKYFRVVGTLGGLHVAVRVPQS
jgi:pimeloyl-ACP methyl ester carboxylesterase